MRSHFLFTCLKFAYSKLLDFESSFIHMTRGQPPNLGFPMFSPQINVADAVGLQPDVEQKSKDLILMNSDKGPKRWKQTKSDYLKKLEADNQQLRGLVVEIQQQISALQAQNDILKDQLSYFQNCLTQAAPLVLQQSQLQK